MFTSHLIAGAAGYLLGALPFGYLVAKAKGVNIFEVGSRNPGATNVKRVLGRGPGNLVFALDVLKGAVATLWPLLLSAPEGAAQSALFQVIGLVGALLGHSFSCFTRFKGGKGVATAAGGFAIILPIPTLVAGALWLLTFFSTRYVSLASLVAAAAIPTVSWLTGRPLIVSGVATAIALFVFIRHRANIGRLLKGTEHKFVKGQDERSR